MGIFHNRPQVDASTESTREAEKGLVRGLLSRNDSSVWQIGTVVEVINDPVYFQKEFAEKYVKAGLLKSKDEYLKYPRNTVLVYIEGDKAGTELTACVPFFSSHVGIPIKVGESVWCTSDGSTYGFWHHRVGGELGTEDPNWSFKDGKFTDPNSSTEEAKETKNSTQGKFRLKSLIPALNNGGADQTNSEPNAKQKKKKAEGEEPDGLREFDLRVNSLQEAIPRWTPRQGDYFIQGSNNTLISLGTDRGWPIDTDPGSMGPYSNAHNKPRPKSGTIDIVAGRGQYESIPLEQNQAGSVSGTAPQTIKTEDGEYVTVDRTPKVNNRDDNPAEGDPCFSTDLSRIYVSMDSEVDLNFYPVDKYGLLYIDPIENKQGPTIAMQTNHFRVYTREEGDIRIVHQGDGETTQSSIIMHTDGRITISGDKIFLGRKEANNSTDHAEDHSAQPWVKYSNLYEYFEEFHNILDKFMQQVQKNRSPGHFATDVVLQQAAIQFNSAQKRLFQDKIKLLQSERIYGE
jgi:hypothetical protein